MIANDMLHAVDDFSRLVDAYFARISAQPDTWSIVCDDGAFRVIDVCIFGLSE